MAKNRYTLRRFLRFQLDQMSPLNQQHQFEELAFELARQRICRRIIPATGPVQAGGDQGRDAETFRSYLASTDLMSRSRIALADDKMLVLACTLDKKLSTKIKNDLETIFASGSKPDAIYYFSTTDLAVAKRHELQAFCERKYGAALEILDGQAIADQLSDPDVFWIAEQFLSVAADMFPEVQGDEEYQALCERWFTSGRVISDYTDFLEVKRGMRCATFEEALKPDLGRWMDLIPPVLDAVPTAFARKALYEIAVAQLRGRKNLDPARWAVDRFFDSIEGELEANDVQDIVLLSTYTMTAHFTGELTVDLETVTGWRDKADEALSDALGGPLSDASRFQLLLIAKQISLDRFSSDPETFAEMVLPPWEEAAEIAERSPFADIDMLNEMMQIYIPMIGSLPRYRTLADRIDAIVEKRGGRTAGAEKGRDRAMIHAKHDQLVAAIDQLQRAKEGWFHAKTIFGSVLAMINLSNFYSGLWMPLAARYYAGAALKYAVDANDETLRPLIGAAALELSATYLTAGEGLSFIHSVGRAAQIFIGHVPDGEELEKQPALSERLSEATKAYAMLGKLIPEAQKDLDAALDTWPIDPAYANSLRKLASKGFWKDLSREDIETRLAEDIGQGLTYDLGAEIHYRWSALGVSWTIRAEQSLRHLAEWIGAALQVAIVDLADEDLAMLPSKVDIEIVLSGQLKPKLEPLDDNKRMAYRLSMPGGASLGDEASFTMMLLAEILGQASALPEDEFLAIIKKKMERGLLNKAFWVHPVSRLFADMRVLMTPEGVDLVGMQPPADAPAPEPRIGKELEWRSGDGPTYSTAKAYEALSNRYRRLTPAIEANLAAIKANPSAMALVQRMHDEGLLDWQIYGVIFNFMLQRAIEAEGHGVIAMAEDAQITQRLMKAFEKGNTPPIDLSEFTPETVETTRWVGLFAAMPSWGLTNHRRTPDMEATRQFLAVRYHHFEDDIEHTPLFDWEPVSGRRIIAPPESS